MDLIFHNLFLHVLIIHAPYIFLIQIQGRVDSAVSVIGKRFSKADIGRRI